MIGKYPIRQQSTRRPTPDPPSIPAGLLFSEGGIVLTTKTEEPNVITKRIGYTTYRASVHFSKTSKETISDKIIRLIKNDTSLRKAVGK